MEQLSVGDLAAVVSASQQLGDPGTLVGPDVVIDSRLATPGCLFVALPGEHADGHDYVAAAAEAGAAAALVSRPCATDIAQIVVPDQVAALSALARRLVVDARHGGMTTVALTGSSGKTSTKDLIAAVFESVGPTVSPAGSFNNEIGVPLTATGVASDTMYLVSEMGARGQGHIRSLCEIVPPDIALVINVGSAHIGEFGTVADIARAKSEIVTGLANTGWAVLNAADDLVAAMAERTSGRLAWFSAMGRPERDGELRCWASDIASDDLARYRFELNCERAAAVTSAPVRLQVIGHHAVANAVAAAAVAVAAGLDVASVAAALSSAQRRSRWRMELTERPDDVAILNDAYNANPDSMRVALDALAEIGAARKARFAHSRTIAVLGVMRELGPGSPQAHRDVGAMAAAAGVDRLVAVGEYAAELAEGAAGVPVIDTFAEKAAVAAALSDLGAGDVVLIKASRGAELDTIATDLVGGLEV